MYLPYSLLQTVLIPLIMASFTAFVGKKVGKKAGWITFSTLAYTTIVLCMVGVEVLRKGYIYEEYVWIPILEVKFGFLADGLSLPVALAMNVTCAALALFSVNYIEHRIEIIYGHGEEKNFLYAIYHSLFLVFPAGLVWISLTTDLIVVYLALELIHIPLYIIMYYFGYVERRRIALMSFLWGTAGASVFFVGVLLAYTQTKSFAILSLQGLTGNPLAFWICLFMLIGILIKMAVFGFQAWLPWVHAEHPTCIAGILANIVGIGNYLIARILIQQMFKTFQMLSIPTMILALVTMVYGAFLTLAQDDVKRLYACSTISQTAYSLLGLASCTTLGIVGGIFWFISHAFGKCILFSLAGVLVYQLGIRDMKQMGGLAQKMPLTAILCILGSMILSAVPPLSGFISKWILFSGVFLQGIQSGLFIFVVAMLSMIATAFTVVYTFWPVKRMFFGPIPSNLKNVKEAPLIMVGPLLALALISILIGIYPNLVMDFLVSWAENLKI